MEYPDNKPRRKRVQREEIGGQMLTDSITKQVYEMQGHMYENIMIPITDGKRLYNISVNLKAADETEGKEIPLVILSSLVLFVCANDMMLDREAVNVISRSDGFVLLAFFLIFMRYTFAIARNGADEAGEEQKIKEMPVWKSVLYIAGGLAGLIFGGQLFVDGASGLALSLIHIFII